MDIEEILRNIWMELGLNSKTELGETLCKRKRVDYFYYSIKHKKITPQLRDSLILVHNVNPEYLKTGKGKILLKKKTPKSGCLECLKKDAKIEGLNKKIEDLHNKYEACLEKLNQ